MSFRRHVGAICLLLERKRYGFRATTSTILSEERWRADMIERQLAHFEKNTVRAAYHHPTTSPNAAT
jgi:hypothetical protein